jgi:hypothetical protein|tara:strand:+ start:97 stop:267 length:171 start_codon:yes stop_codon:yes gene_type:complete
MADAKSAEFKLRSKPESGYISLEYQARTTRPGPSYPTSSLKSESKRSLTTKLSKKK